MNEKERIIELVRQNVITMEEALVLLEAGTQSTDTAPNKEPKQTTTSQSAQPNREPEVNTSKEQETAKAKANEFSGQVTNFVNEVVGQSLNVAKNVTDYVTKFSQEIKPKNTQGETSHHDATDYSQEYRQAQADVEETVRASASADLKEEMAVGERERVLEEKETSFELLEDNLAELEEAIILLEAELSEADLAEDERERMEAEKTAKTNALDAIQVELDRLEVEIKQLNQTTTSSEEFEAAAARVAEKSGKLSATIDQLNEDLNKKQEALTIAKQRLRELEIFEELDELTEEMTEQKERFTTKVATLEQEITDLEALLVETKGSQEALYHSQVNRYKDNFRSFVDEQSGKVTEVAGQFSSEAVKEGKKFGKLMSHHMKDFIENFNTKEVNLSVNVPWVKTQRLDHTFEYDAAEVTELDFELTNGSLEFVSHDKATIEIVSDLRFHGQHKEISVERFIDLSTIAVNSNQFIFHVNSAKLSLDATVKLPRHLFNQFSVTAVNGDLSLSSIETKDLIISNKNGDITLNHLTADLLDLDLLNGDVKLVETDIKDISLKNLNGDFRITGNVGNIIANTVNTDYFITKKNLTPSNLKIEGVNGDVKIALPQAVNLEVNCKTSFGDVRQRLTNVDAIAKKRSQLNLQRMDAIENPLVKVSVSLTSGDVYLKDTIK